MFPYAVLPLYVASLSFDLEFLRVAESLGASRRRAMFNICLPLTLAGIVATTIIDYVLCLGFFLMPLLLGGVSVPFTANAVWQDVTDFFDLTQAAMSSLILLVAALVVIIIGYFGVGRERLTRAMA
jgi:ABC-type spermidine/putrescine transport system permease subunit I